jgi:hypothetical protein
MSRRSIHSMIDSRSSSIDRSIPLRADSAWRRKFSTDTPWISWGYWKARKSPALPRTSGPQAVMSSPWNQIRPSVISYSGLPSRVEASVDLPEPLGPMSACTEPVSMVRSTPLRMGTWCSSAVATWRFSIRNSGSAMVSSVLALSP